MQLKLTKEKENYVFYYNQNEGAPSEHIAQVARDIGRQYSGMFGNVH